LSLLDRQRLTGALGDETPLQLTEHGHHRGGGLACGGAGVDRQIAGDQLPATAPRLRHERGGVEHRPRYPVELGGEQTGSAARLYGLDGGGQAGAVLDTPYRR
jgi:hypothetical protein